MFLVTFGRDVIGLTQVSLVGNVLCLNKLLNITWRCMCNDMAAYVVHVLSHIGENSVELILSI